MSNKINLGSPKEKLIVYILLTFVTLAVFWQVNHYDFINFDDNIYIIQNGYIQSGLTPEGFRWAFSTKYFDLWNPLVWLSFMLDYQIHGLSAGGYHLTNLILHVLSTLLLFRLFSSMTGAVWKSAFVAGFFALHPLHVESVAWIAERKDVLSAFFWMLTLCLYVHYTKKPVIERYVPVILSFVLALISKPMVVTLPVIMILLDYWPLRRFESQKNNPIIWQLREKAPFFILSAVLALITIYSSFTHSYKLFPLSSRLANAPVSFVTYLIQTLWPHDLAVFYPFPESLPHWQVWSSVLLIIITVFAVIALAKRLPYLFTGWMWYIITIAPVIGIIQISTYSMADHYHYLPSIGIAVMLAWGVPSLIKNKDRHKNSAFFAGIIFLTIMSILTWQQCGYWKNSISLFGRTLQVTKDNYLMQNNLGVTLFEEGKITEALDRYDEAIRIKPDYADAYYNRGNAYARLISHQTAIENYNKAISLKPDYVQAYLARGNTHARLGNYQPAIENYNAAIQMMPDNADAYINRAFVSLNTGDKESGCRDARTACELGNCMTLRAAAARGYCK